MKFSIAVLFWIAGLAAAFAECRDDRAELRGDWGTAQFRVEIADTVEERSVGLMHRPSMPASAGMVFYYPQPQLVRFWMRNTLIPLDMIFMTPDGTIQKIHENAIPLDETLIVGGEDIQAVLEINGGMSKLLGITVGSQMRHPGLQQNIAAWPCD